MVQFSLFYAEPNLGGAHSQLFLFRPVAELGEGQDATAPERLPCKNG